MPELTLQLILFLICLGLFTSVAAFLDLRWGKIPNVLTMSGLALGLGYQIWFNGWNGLADAGLGFLLGFGMLFVLWIIGGGGGGDVKLMGTLGVWLGFKLTLLVIIVSTLFVAVGTVAMIGFSLMTAGYRKTKSRYLMTGKSLSKKQKQSSREANTKKPSRRGMRYAGPIAVATWLIVILKLPEFPFMGP